jgi:ribonuclease HI
MSILRVYTDGSSSANGRKNCTSGCGVYFLETDERLSLTSSRASLLCGVELQVESNNVGELLGILTALVHCKDKDQDLVIYTDSMYCLNSITMWSPSWIERGWITAGGTPVKNKEIIRKILHEKSKFKSVYFKHVRAHKKEPDDKDSDEWRDWHGNDVADKLATDAVHKKVIFYI